VGVVEAFPSGKVETKGEIPPSRTYLTNPSQEGDTRWWTVWLGWHSAEKISAEPKGRLTRVRNPG